MDEWFRVKAHVRRIGGCPGLVLRRFPLPNTDVLLLAEVLRGERVAREVVGIRECVFEEPRDEELLRFLYYRLGV
jgi:hypothetical protein